MIDDVLFHHFPFFVLASVDRESIELTSAYMDLSRLSFLSDLKMLDRLRRDELEAELEP